MSTGQRLLDHVAPEPRARVSRCRLMAASRQQLLAEVTALSLERTLELVATGRCKRVRRLVLERLSPELLRAPGVTLPLRFGATIVAVRPLQEVVVSRAVRGTATLGMIPGSERRPNVVGALRLDSVPDGTDVCIELRIVGSGVVARGVALCLGPLLSVAGAAAGRWLSALDRAVVTPTAAGPEQPR